MNITLFALLFAVGLLVGMLGCLELGWRVGKRRLAADPEGLRAGLGAVEGAIFALLGLLVAFTFSGAAARFDARRALLVAEANNIGTAWLRIDLLPEAAQPALRELFRQYLDSRLETYRKLPDLAAVQSELAHSAQLQGEIWSQSLAACRAKNDGPTTALVVGALNAMIDITTTRTAAAWTHPPPIIYGLLFVLSLACALLAGYGMAAARTRSWTHLFGFALVMAISIYVILDLEHPRVGLIRVDDADRVLIELRQSMK